LETYVLKETGDVLIKGKSVGSKIGSGEVNVIKEAKDIGKFKKGQVLVTDMTDPDWEPIMKIASAIVTNRGGRTCHAAIISRELGIPCVVGTNTGTEALANGQIVTVSCAQGEDGFVYEGKLKYVVDKVNISDLKRPNTKVMMNVGNPEQAFALSFIPNDGVGLAREEFIINSYIGIHPKAMLNFHNLKDKELKATIEKKTEGYVDKAQYYVDKLAEGIATLSAAFYPKKVILRFSDFKTNEYANLIGGTLYEPVEDNPMIGWRGTSRYYDPKFSDCFALECRAVKKVREDMGLTNLEVMIPFCRTLEEGKAVLNEMAKNGLIKGENGLKINLMCEIPSNVLLADQFLDLFDGYSIGSNDLTQLTLGVDRDSELVAHVYDERNPAVKSLIAGVINIANEKGKYIGICGQAPSDYEDFAQFLVEAGIQSISLNPDTVIKTTIKINEKEEELYRNQFN
ncbi:MAG: phosphoenolpyruvate synthase, partial [Candidatus Nanoarchaeia archaeon]|nr:phosphoenolpyruvate synthase [Candidatus Nanoarchaeia archaeon]